MRICEVCKKPLNMDDKERHNFKQDCEILLQKGCNVRLIKLPPDAGNCEIEIDEEGTFYDSSMELMERDEKKLYARVEWNRNICGHDSYGKRKAGHSWIVPIDCIKAF